MILEMFFPLFLISEFVVLLLRLVLLRLDVLFIIPGCVIAGESVVITPGCSVVAAGDEVRLLLLLRQVLSLLVVLVLVMLLVLLTILVLKLLMLLLLI